MTSSAMRLVAVAEKTLPQEVEADLLEYCPTMDLVALGSKGRYQVTIYRLNGQRVSGAQKTETVRLDQICWKPNGRARGHDVLLMTALTSNQVNFSRQLGRMARSS